MIKLKIVIPIVIIIGSILIYSVVDQYVEIWPRQYHSIETIADTFNYSQLSITASGTASNASIIIPTSKV